MFAPGYSLESYAAAFGKLGSSIQNTIIIPMLALAVIVLLAILIAYLVTRRRNAATNIVDILSMIPYIVTILALVLFVGILLMSVVVGIVESVVARMRFLKTPQILLGTLMIAALGTILYILF